MLEKWLSATTCKSKKKNVETLSASYMQIFEWVHIVQSMKNASLKVWEESLTQKSTLHIYRRPPDRQSTFYKSDAFCDVIWYQCIYCHYKLHRKIQCVQLEDRFLTILALEENSWRGGVAQQKIKSSFMLTCSIIWVTFLYLFADGQ
jgi:hypothetical protein